MRTPGRRGPIDLPINKRLLAVLEHPLQLRDRMLILDHPVLQLVPLIAQIREHRVLLDQHLLYPLILIQRVRVHLPQIIQLSGQAHQRLAHLYRLLVPLHLLN